MVANLEALYDYMGRRLLQANMSNDPALIDEVLGLLVGLKDAWAQIDPTRAAQQQDVQRANQAASQSYGQV